MLDGVGLAREPASRPAGGRGRRAFPGHGAGGQAPGARPVDDRRRHQRRRETTEPAAVLVRADGQGADSRPERRQDASPDDLDGTRYGFCA